MAKTIKYIGVRDRWPELPVTGKQSQWRPGQTDERSDAEVALLMGTGLFEGVTFPAGADPVAGTLYVLPGGKPSLVSGAWNEPGSFGWMLANQSSFWSDSARLYIDGQPIFVTANA